MEEHEAAYHTVSGASICASFFAGGKFTMTQHHLQAEEKQEYVLLRVVHRANDYTYVTANMGPPSYDNTFDAFPAATKFRPVSRTHWPVVQGPQTATVVGPGDIHTDKYGRVKLQFHWDRRGKKDDKSSCWVRVSQNWAGKVYEVLNHGALPDLLDAAEEPRQALDFRLEAREVTAEGTPAPVRMLDYGEYYPPGPARQTGWTTYAAHRDGPYFVFGNQIKPEFRGDRFRPTFFAAGWRVEEETLKSEQIDEARKRAASPAYAAMRTAWLNALPPAERATADPILIEMCDVSGIVIKRTMWNASDTSQIELDHIEEVARFWNRLGNNTPHQARRDFYYEPKNLQILDKPTNASKGGPSVNPAVGPGFRGPSNRP